MLYRVELVGELGTRFEDAFPVVERRAGGGRTVLTVDLADQSALHGFLDMLEALGIELTSVQRLDPGA